MKHSTAMHIQVHNGLYHSTNDGLTWSHVFKPPNEWLITERSGCPRTATQNDVFCTRENSYEGLRRLRLYTVDKRLPAADIGRVTNREINVP